MTHDAAPDAVLSDAGLQSLTSDKRRNHATDALYYAQMADRQAAYLAHLDMPDDNFMSARWRSWWVPWHARRMSRLSRKIAKLNQSWYSSYNKHVTRLPERRHQKALDKAKKSPAVQQVNSATIQLNGTTQYLNPTPPTIPIRTPTGAPADEWSIYSEFPQDRQAL